MRFNVKVCSICQNVFDASGHEECDCGGMMVLRRLELDLPTHQQQTHKMMVAWGIPLCNEKRPRADNLQFALLRDLVAEEAQEFYDAMVRLEFVVSMNCGTDLTPYWAEAIDAICDIDVVIHNASNAMGIDIEPFFQEVMRTNMAKVGGPTRPDGKKLKPEGWEPPRIQEMLEEVLRESR